MCGVAADHVHTSLVYGCWGCERLGGVLESGTVAGPRDCAKVALIIGPLSEVCEGGLEKMFVHCSCAPSPLVPMLEQDVGRKIPR